MIARYTLPQMGAVWSDENRFRLWAEVEILVLQAHVVAGRVAADVVDAVRAARIPTPAHVSAAELLTGHDVIAFLQAWATNTVPATAASQVHLGMTSSDLVDTALAVQLAQATDLLTAKASRLIAILREHALVHQATIRPGRTHGIHAEPDTWGHRVADFAFGLARCRDRLLRAREAVAVCAISGPVGTYVNLGHDVERYVAQALGLRPADVSTQVVLRDGIAEWVSAIALTATVCEAIAVEIRHGQRTEVGELREPFGRQQRGSSAMPHKRNPVLSERITGLARVVRAQVVPVMEGVVLWHERDISHSSVERVALPDAAICLDYLLELTIQIMEGLVVDDARMLRNLDLTGGLIYSSSVLTWLVESGFPREQAYALVKTAAEQTRDTGMTFREALRSEAQRQNCQLDDGTIDDLCRPERYIARLGPVFERLREMG